MSTPTALLLLSPGTNCDREAEFAWQRVGANTTRLHINQLRHEPHRLEQAQILFLPGGFSYGDDVAAGKILASQLENQFADVIREFRDQDKLVLGICNGFQALLKSGVLLQPDEDGPLATLAHNQSGKYEDRWVHLQVQPTKSPFLQGIQRMYVPVAHGEGQLICRQQWILDGLSQAGQVALRYTTANGQVPNYPDNPNGSQGHIAGLCDPSGQVLGLMPHPERHILPTQHPQWTRHGLQEHGDGLALFQNAVEYFS